MITIGIPTFKRPELLKRAIYSVLKQENVEYQIFVSVDGNRDQIEGYLKIENFFSSYKNVAFYFHNENIGSLKNFLFLINSCKTKYFMWLTDDDEISANYFDSLLDLLEKQKDVVTAVPYWIRVNEKQDIELVKPSNFPYKSIFRRLISYCDETDDVFFYGLHRTEILKNCSFKGYSWPNKGSLSNWCYVFQMDLILQGKIQLTEDKNCQWINHDYGMKFYPQSSSKKFIKNITYSLRRLNIYYLYLRKILKWKQYLFFLVFMFLFPYFFMRDIIFGEKISKKINL